jgi:ubiquinone biosynthesis protein COQ4
MALTDTLPQPFAATRRPRPKTDWLHALQSLRRLLADKEDTAQVFEIMRALNGASTAKGYEKLLTTREGGRLAYERLELAPRLMDDAWLDSFAEGSVGAAYRSFVRDQDLSAQGLVDISRANSTIVDEPHPYAWFGRRTRDIHDVWHILTGYGRDGLGEACLVAFSYAQTRSLGWAFIAMGAIARSPGGWNGPYVRAIREGYSRGRKAAWLQGEDYERLLAEPLEAARRRLGLETPAAYAAIPADARG